MNDLIKKMGEFSSELDKINEMDARSLQNAKEIAANIQQKLRSLRKGIEDAVCLLPINELKGQKFFIPKYQRGYRWEKRQVEELLNDLRGFFEDEESGARFYCLQPVVVCRDDDARPFDVVDGQQRLTTLYILLQVLGVIDFYEIDYETRTDSRKFLLNLKDVDVDSKEVRSNPDFYYMAHARKVITEWMDGRDVIWRNAFAENLLKKVRVIWYRADGEDAISVFTRLNIGKIRLTGAELIKALLLSGGCTTPCTKAEVERKRIEISNKWDEIEHRLQDDTFWMFVNDGDAYPNTRIDFLFDLLVAANALGLSKNELAGIGKDDICNFRYLNVAFERVDTSAKWKEIVKTWDIIQSYFDALEEWYSDLKLYHYIGFLSIECQSDKRGKLFLDLLKLWTKPSSDKRLFVKELESRIDVALGIPNGNDTIDFAKVYDRIGADGKVECPKTQCRPILLFHNIMTIIKQNEESEKSYAMSAFERFPFHLSRQEKGWDVEHIASNTDNQLTEYDDQRAWLVGNMVLVSRDADLTKQIKTFIEKGEKKVKDGDFDSLKKSIEDIASLTEQPGGSLDGDDKNRLWNFALLDSGTNRSYGNALFPAKRNFIIARARGVRKAWNTDQKEWKDELLPGAFVPICTRNAFLKTYTPDSDIRFLEWDKRDAEYYRDDMKSVFKYYFDNKVKEVK